MRYGLYTKSKNAWDSMLAEMEKANIYIFIEIYIFNPDTKETHDFLGLLKRKAENGVKVVIVADASGSSDLKKEYENLKKSGVEIIFFSNWLRHIHRKICIIDNRIAFIGGVNIGKRFKNWNDLHLKLHGKKLIQRLLKSFAYTYEMSGGKDKEILEMRKRKLSYKLKFWLVEHLPHKNIHTLRRSYQEKITEAKKSIVIVTPYFAPPRWLISLLDVAIKRGVEIDIIVPKKVDTALACKVNLSYIEKLSKIGIKFFLTNQMNHSKLLIVDCEKAILGSQNFDIISFGINTEAGVFFDDKALIEKLLKTIEEWKKESTIFHLEKYKRGILDYVVILLIKIFNPIL